MSEEINAGNIEEIAVESDTRERIIDAAIDLFSRKGYEAASMREVAEVVGIRKSSIYSHFKKKEEILETILKYFIAELGKTGYQSSMDDETIHKLLMESGPEGLMSKAGDKINETLGVPRMQKIWRMISIEMCRNVMIRSFFKRQMIDQPLRFWEKAFRIMMVRQLIPAGDAAAMAREFYSFTIYIYLKYLLLSCDIDFESIKTEASKESISHVKYFLERIK